MRWCAILLGNRLVQFLSLGGLLFILTPSTGSPTHIELSRRHIAALQAAQATRQGSDTLPESHASEVESRAIEDEVLYREALRLGLDQSDPLIRQHLIQKVLLLAEDLGGAGRDPSEPELRRYFEETRQRWVMPGEVRLLHVFASEPASLAALRPRLQAHEAVTPEALPPLGEPFPLSRDVRSPQHRLAAEYGPDFTQAAWSLPIGTWSEPVASRYGWHLVKVLSRTEVRPATFEDVRTELVLDFAIARRKRVVSQFVARALERYTFTVDSVPVTPPSPSGRLGIRTEASAED
ncbi:peptidyl-prolyl cis-trans isomerase [Hyalangium gracile]|uniref:peptidylprolyl isomerase n=1 Tax=Hyalangium gracile TaxID=394092 RepID=UPI001CC97F91|nr:peptidylprolyl isomerase [Hyalangium gracile]